MAPPTPPTPEALRHYAEAFSNSATMKLFGLRLSFPEGKRAEAVLDPIKPEHRGGLGSDAVNGGVLAAIFDLVIGCAPALFDPTRRTATVELSMHFMKSVKGERLVARSKIDRSGNTLVFVSAEILDGNGEVCATAHGISRISDKKWANDGTPAIN